MPRLRNNRASRASNIVFAERLSSLLLIKKVSQQALSEATGVQRQTISFYATGQGIPDIERLKRIADFLGVSCNYLSGIDDCPTLENSCISRITGLSDETIENLKYFKSKSDMTAVCAVIDSILPILKGGNHQ